MNYYYIIIILIIPIIYKIFIIYKNLNKKVDKKLLEKFNDI